MALVRPMWRWHAAQEPLLMKSKDELEEQTVETIVAAKSINRHFHKIYRSIMIQAGKVKLVKICINNT
jgi:hypothetical protein